jgi:hypothetical protein
MFYLLKHPLSLSYALFVANFRKTDFRCRGRKNRRDKRHYRSLRRRDYPPVIGLVARYRRRLFFMSRSRISTLNENGARMNTEVIDLKPFNRRTGEVLLAKDVLDNQLIDVDGNGVVRVNDVQIIEVGREWRVTGADVSFQGFCAA